MMLGFVTDRLQKYYAVLPAVLAQSYQKCSTRLLYRLRVPFATATMLQRNSLDKPLQVSFMTVGPTLMEELFDCPPSCFTTGGSDSIAVGFMDGIVQMAKYDLAKKSFQTQWKFKTKAGVRGMQYSRDQSEIFAITSNKGISCFDVETGKRKRCIMRGHDDKPTAICLLQPTASKHQQFATGDESGEILFTVSVGGGNPSTASKRTRRDRAAHDGIVAAMANLGFLGIPS
ncbi:hypothetical protein Y032_0098g3080 [Ancylostoma ceylanicum]|uniref:Anaphase-promoting complex subunit 4 WD40 domain-containing protein n=1 Tax=Ancylostoma ceylanicum TaxID=53326 RepID=A0A016TJ61_9BILA|nr:hypothetical protein Y032_0098g3080 [Ancylostoma ceylanicum]